MLGRDFDRGRRPKWFDEEWWPRFGLSVDELPIDLAMIASKGATISNKESHGRSQQAAIEASL
jgi:hypothetical protein